jgi:hypothetical protein
VAKWIASNNCEFVRFASAARKRAVGCAQCWKQTHQTFDDGIIMKHGIQHLFCVSIMEQLFINYHLWNAVFSEMLE